MPIIVQGDGIIVNVSIVPRASRTEIVGVYDDVLKIRIAAPPVDGAANAELVRLLARTFKISKSEITIIGGETSRKKRIKIRNLSESKFREVTR